MLEKPHRIRFLALEPIAPAAAGAPEFFVNGRDQPCLSTLISKPQRSDTPPTLAVKVRILQKTLAAQGINVPANCPSLEQAIREQEFVEARVVFEFARSIFTFEPAEVAREPEPANSSAKEVADLLDWLKSAVLDKVDWLGVGSNSKEAAQKRDEALMYWARLRLHLAIRYWPAQPVVRDHFLMQMPSTLEDARELLVRYDDMVRSLCLSLSVGGYNNEHPKTPERAERDLREGIDYLTRPLAEWSMKQRSDTGKKGGGDA